MKNKITDKYTPLASILVPLFKVLNGKKIPYCVTGNYKGLPEFTSHDVDIWVEDKRTVERILSKIAKNKGFKNHLIYRTSGGIVNILHRFEKDGSINFIRIDLVGECSWLWVFTLVPLEIRKKRKRLFKNFYVPNPPVESATKLLYTLIARGKIRDKYKEMIFTRRTHPIFFKILSQSLGRKPAEWLLKQIEKKNWCEIENKICWFRLHIIKQNVFNYFGIREVLILFKSIILYIEKYLRPRGIFIAFLGPDGCGKSTLCKRIPQILQEGFMPHGVKTFYWRPMLFPKIRKLLSYFRIKSISEDFTTTGAQDRKPDNYFASSIRFIYYWLDFVLGSLKFNSVRARGGIVLFDRYYHDFFVYPERFRLRLPGWLLKIFMPIIPHPDIIFYLDADPNLLISRKEEISLDELKRQIHSYRHLVSSIPNAYIIDANQYLDKVIEDVSRIVMNFMGQRLEEK